MGIKISALPPQTTPDGADELPTNDVSATTTKKLTLTILKEWLQSLAGWITTAMIGNGQVTSSKIDFTSFGNGGEIIVQSKVVFNSSSGTLTAAGNVFYMEVTTTGGTWPVPFSQLLGAFVMVNNRQFWVTVDDFDKNGYGGIRLYKFSSASQSARVTVVGIGLK